MTNTSTKWAAGWAAVYGTVALIWTVLGRGYPFGPADSRGANSALRALDASVGAPVLAGVLLVAAVALLIMNGWDAPRGPGRIVLLGYVGLVAALLLLIIPDMRLLTVLGYLPILIIGFPFGYPPIDYADVFTLTLANQAFAVLGGLLLVRAALAWHFRTSGACERCGRDHRGEGWTAPAAAARWGRRWTWPAAVIPVLYAVVRLAWAVGIPLGIDQAFLDDMHRTGVVWAGAGLGGFALAGSILTLGLIQRWGEVFPRWMIGLAGKRVPIRLATVPATLVSIFVMSASIAFFSHAGALGMIAREGLAASPLLTWPLWSVALGAATLGYHLRRRPGCLSCGRGDSPAGVVHQPATGAY
jgi:hypothetical protein